MNSTIRIGFVDFWGGYVPEKEFIYRALSKRYNIIVDNKSPDILFYSCFGTKHLTYSNVLRICYYGENLVPNYNICDYSISFLRDSINGRNLWLPQAIRWTGGSLPTPMSDSALLERKFCNFVYSNETCGFGASLRKQVCSALMQYRHVDCPGKVLHNMDAPELSARLAVDWHATKIKFLRNYKFNIAFENSSFDGYMTEKLLDAFIAGSVPIYWGSEGNVAPFSKDCMICANDYADIDSLVERIREVDSNSSLYLDMCAANPIRQGILPNYEEITLTFLSQIIENGFRPVLKDEFNLDPVHKLYKDKLIVAAQKCKRLAKKIIGIFK